MQPSAATDREFHLSDREFDEIRRLVREHTGISLAASKRELVYSRLVRRLRLPPTDCEVTLSLHALCGPLPL